jgi:hypothetical protein
VIEAGPQLGREEPPFWSVTWFVGLTAESAQNLPYLRGAVRVGGT